MKLKEKPNVDKLMDHEGTPYSSLIEAEGSVVAAYKKAVFGPGVFLHVFGTTWQNAPGARYPQERDVRVNYTYCRNKTAMTDRIKQILRERETLAQQQASG